MRLFRKTFTEQAAEKEKHFSFSACLLGLFRGFLRFLFLLLCACATAWLANRAYPKASQNWLAWLAFAPFIWGICKIKSFWGSFFYAWLTALILNAGIYYWIYYTCVHGGGLSVGLAAGAWLGLSALMGIPFACFGGSCCFLKKLGNLFPLLAAFGVVAWEWLHQTLAFYVLGFPWFMWGYTQWNAPEMLQLASFTGVYGISFFVAFTGISVGYAFGCKGFKRAFGQTLAAAAVFFCVFSYGKSALERRTDFQPLLSVQTALLQPNIDQYKKWSPAFENEILNTVDALSDRLVGRNRMLAVWPESVTPGPLSEERYQTLFENIARRTGAYQIVGSNTQKSGAQYVSAYLVPPAQTEWGVYNKVQLVPFGEYIPFENTLRSVFKDVAVLGELGSFSAGALNQPLLGLPGVPFGVTICYESVFPQLWRAQNLAGAKFFVNITNDAWYFDTAAPYQHLAINVLRAVETGRPVLRAANTGISAVIDPFGRIEQYLALNTQGVLFATVPLALENDINFYTRWGDWFAWLCAAFYFTLLISTFVFAYE